MKPWKPTVSLSSSIIEDINDRNYQVSTSERSRYQKIDPEFVGLSQEVLGHE